MPLSACLCARWPGTQCLTGLCMMTVSGHCQPGPGQLLPYCGRPPEAGAVHPAHTTLPVMATTEE